MAAIAPKYYRPYYPSDSEEESDASAYSDSDAYSESDEDQNIPDFKSFAQGLFRAAGPPLPTPEKEIEFAHNTIDRRTTYGPLVKGQEGFEMVTTVQQSDNVIVLQSLDRDKLIYPQPINCQLMLPRVYQNVTKFEIADISFIASFFSFCADKYNISFTFNETGRVLCDVVLAPPSSTKPLILTVNIREGTYTIDTLLQELTIQCNTPPLFYDFINGYSDFYNKFINEGDYSINFNYPGDYYYDALRKLYITNPTTQQIVSYYFQQQYALPTNQSVNNTFTNTQILNAYYYPVMKELLLDTNNKYTLPLSDTDINHIIYNYNGLDDTLVASIISNNTYRDILDKYRLEHTFRYFPINNYIFTYTNQNTKVSIQSATLNTSLVTLLNTTYTGYLNTQIQRNNISLTNFLTSSTQITAYKSIVSDMYNIIQSNFAHIFGVNKGTFSDKYFTSFSNVFLLKNGKNATNVSYDYNSNTGTFIGSNIQNTFQQSNTVFWPYMFQTSPSNTTIDSNYSTYNPRLLQVQTQYPFQDSNGNIYTNPVEFTCDIIVNVNPGAYTIIPVNSTIRQTMQVETIPRPYVYLYSEWNATHRDEIGLNQSIFSNGEYTYSSSNIQTKIQNPLSPALSNIGTLTYDSSNTSNTSNTSNILFSNQTTTTLTLLATPNGTYFTFTTPSESHDTSIIYKYKISLSFFPGTPSPLYSNGTVVDTNESQSTFSESMVIFVYHDEAAFYADAGLVGQSNGESYYFYKYKMTLEKGSGANTIQFSAYESQQYYILCRPVNKSVFPPITFTVIPFCIPGSRVTLTTTDTSFDPRLSTFNPYTLMASNYIVAKVHDPDYIRLPIIDSNGYYYKTTIQSGRIGYLPSASNNPAITPINTLLQKKVIPLGYSTSNISNDLTDYIPIPDTYPARACDPITGYIFQYSPNTVAYDSVSETYAIGQSNILLDPSGGLYLTSNTYIQRETKIVQYKGTHYIYTESNDFTVKSSNLHPLNNSSFAGLNSPFETRGVNGFLFLPEEGTWNINKIRLLCQTSNTNVHFLAIYPTSYVTGVSLTHIKLEQAISILVLQSSKTYYSTNAPAGVPYGTYYTYCNVLNINYKYVVAGKTQASSNFISDTNAYYSAIAYSFSDASVLSNTTFPLSVFSNAVLAEIENLTGTCIPYPELGTRISTVFYDGTVIPDPRYSMILSQSGLPTNVDINVNNPNIYTSQFAQSSPIVNSHLHYVESDFTIHDFERYTDFFLSWYSIPDIPTDICVGTNGSLLLQTSVFPIITYPTDSQATTFNLQTILTIDSIFPVEEETVILSQAGSANAYVFLGYTSSSNIVFKTYDNTTGEIRSYPKIPSPIFHGEENKVQGFVVNGTEWWLCYLNGSNGMNIAYGSNFTDSYIEMSNAFPGPYTAAQICIDPEYGYNIYFSVSTASDYTFSKIYKFSSFVQIPNTNILSSSSFIKYSISNASSFSVQTVDGREYIYATVASKSYLYRMDTQTNIIKESAQNLNNIPIKCIVGRANSLWILFNTEPYIMAYTFTPVSMQIAWQLLFPTMKIEMVRVDEKRLAIPDTYNISTPEWYHSVLFAYNNSVNLNRDLQYAGLNRQWGQENNFVMNSQVADTSFQGYYFNAYLQDVPLEKINTSYITLRGFSPTESYQTELRISMPNVYDYGYISINNLINEIASINTTPGLYSASYREQLSTFDGSFVRSNSDALYGISSFSVPTTGFSNFITEFSTIYSKYTIMKSTVDIINTSLIDSMNTFILNDMQYILPANILSRTRFTDSLTFKLLWKTGLATTPPNNAKLVDGWGLGWNLGYAKEDDTTAATIHFAPSMYKIIEDFLYLRLNPEFNLNRMSAGTKENYLDSREPSGLTSYYYCKLLLNGYGQTANTFVHSPVILNPPIARMSKMSFQWIDSKGNLLNIPSATDSDWQMTVNIQENVNVIAFKQKAVGSVGSITSKKE